MSETVQQAKEVFLDALNHDEGDSRDEFLDRVCGEDTALRRRVESLITAHQLPDSILDRTEALPKDQSLEHAGQMIGPYKILQRIGEGGMGTVYMADQKQPVKRRVALKIIKPGMDTKQVMARFEAERQALAMMDHPNIAKVLEAGTTENGRPYFVMELVKGVPITQYCDDNRLSTRHRLSLFVDVCQAVQHAHQKGIIHRDLKPSNVLVAKFDDKPVVKVIDFGVAKAINQELSQQTLFTEFGQVIGTLEYMSPEQAQFNQLDIDTRSDIYSLGVLLYELLAGEPPFDRRRLRTAALDEVMRIIREEDPPKPSTRLSTLGQDAQSVSEKRGTDIGGLGRTIRGDIDLIVMKALEKNRARRYETANGLAMDICRYLSDEAITARPPSTSYRVRKLVSRNRGLFAAATAVVLALSSGMVWALAERNAARKSQQILNLAIEHQRGMIREQTLLALLRGDYTKFDELLPDTESLGLSREWIVIMKGLKNHLQGDSEATIRDLQELGATEQDDISALALSAIAYGEIADEDKRFQQMALLKDLEPENFEEHLLKGIGLFRWLPSEGEECLRNAAKMRPLSPVVRLLLADARCSVAANLPDHQAAIALTENAIEMTDALVLLTDREPRFLATSIQARLQQAHLLALIGDHGRSRNLIESLGDDVRQLTESSGHESAMWWPPMVDLIRGEPKLAFRGFTERANAGLKNSDYIATYLAANCFEDEKFGNGIQLLDQMTKPCKDNVDGLKLCLELAKPDAHHQRQDVLHRLQENFDAKQSRQSSKFFLFIDWTVAKMLGEDVFAKEIGETLYASALRRNLFPEEIACADFMRGTQTDASELVQQCRNSQLFTAYAHWVIGFDRLARGQRQEAEMHFSKIAQTADFQHGLFWWGKAFHSRVKDKTWLPWLDSRQVHQP